RNGIADVCGAERVHASWNVGGRSEEAGRFDLSYGQYIASREAEGRSSGKNLRGNIIRKIGLCPIVEILCFDSVLTGAGSAGAKHIDGAKDKEFVLYDGAAKGCAYFVTRKLRDCRFELCPSRKGIIEKVVIDASVEVVCTRFCENVDCCAAITPFLG